MLKISLGAAMPLSGHRNTIIYHRRPIKAVMVQNQYQMAIMPLDDMITYQGW